MKLTNKDAKRALSAGKMLRLLVDEERELYSCVWLKRVMRDTGRNTIMHITVSPRDRSSFKDRHKLDSPALVMQEFRFYDPDAFKLWVLTSDKREVWEDDDPGVREYRDIMHTYCRMMWDRERPREFYESAEELREESDDNPNSVPVVCDHSRGRLRRGDNEEG